MTHLPPDRSVPSDELTDLYHEIVLEHARRPRNMRALGGAGRSAEGFNPLCGDRVTVYIDIEANFIRDIAFTGAGCAICTASASLMTEDLKGRTQQEARRVFTRFQSMVTQETARNTASGCLDDVDRLGALAGVRRFPMRVKCATLPWHTMLAALDQCGESISTE